MDYANATLATVDFFANNVAPRVRPFLPMIRTIQTPFLEFQGWPSLFFHTLRARPIIGHLSPLLAFLGTLVISMGGAHARNILLGQPLTMVTSTLLIPKLFMVWAFVQLLPTLVTSLPVRLVILTLTAFARVRVIEFAVSQATLALGASNIFGIMLVAFAQGAGQSLFLMLIRQLMTLPHATTEISPWHFGMQSAVLAAVGLSLSHGSEWQPLVFAALLVWFELMALKFAFSWNSPVVVVKAPANKRKNKNKTKDE